MPEPQYTPEFLRKFDHLTDRLSSRDQMTRIEARMEITRFIEAHGKDTCDAMFAVLQKRDAKRKG